MVKFRNIQAAFSTNWLYIIAGTLILTLITFFLEHPLIMPDSIRNMTCAFEGVNKVNNTAAYSLFLKWTSLGFSTWFVALLQNFIISFVIHRVLKVFFPGYYNVFFIIIITILLCSSLPWISNLLLSDIFSSVGLFSIFLILINRKSHKIDYVIFGSLFGFSLLFHKSHFALFFIILAFSGAYFYIKKEEWYIDKKVIYTNFGVLVGIFLFSLLILRPASKYILSGSSSSNLGYRYYRLVEKMNISGFLVPYLDENCSTKTYRLCNRIDEITPGKQHGLPYGGYPFYKKDSENILRESKQIFFDVIKKPKYLLMHFWYSFRQGFKLMFDFKIVTRNSKAVDRYQLLIKEHLPYDDILLDNLRRNDKKLTQFVGTSNILNYFLLFFSFILLFTYPLSSLSRS